ncbi:MAG: hypothetical protein ACI4J4_02625 [Ruminiclostridium sp.]
MNLKSKTFQIITRVLCGIFLVLAIVLGVIAAACSIGGGVPNIFGANIYIVKTDAFELKNGTALFAYQVPPSEIQPGNFVIINLENNKPALAEILNSELYDGVYSFVALTENNSEITLSQSQIVAKGLSYSDFWGQVISFAVSPLGTLTVAVLPCLVIIITELSKFIGKIMPQPEIETVKKQLEVPTYSPESAARRSPRRKQTLPAPEEDSLDDSIGLYDAQVRKNASVERTDVLEISREPETPLFSAPKRPREPQRGRDTRMPLSQKKLNEAIAATKAEHELAQMNKLREQTVKDIQKTRGSVIAAEKAQEEAERLEAAAAAANTAAAPRKAQPDSPAKAARPAAQPPKPEFKPEFRSPERPSRPSLKLQQEEQVKQYTPKRSSTTTSIPRLDALLEDDSESSYSIDEILAGLERKKNEK